MRNLLFAFVLLVASVYARAASYAVTGVTILGTNSNTLSACYTAQACNGWVAAISISTVATGGTYSLGFSQTTNNKPSSATIILTVTSSGYQGGANCGTATTYTRTVYGTHVLREPYPNASTNDEVSGFTTNIALSDRIFSGETVTAVIGAGFYTDGSSNTNSAYSGSVTNSSTLPYSYARALFNWTYPGWNLYTGSTLTVRGTGFSAYPMNSLPLACVVYTITDAHSNSVTATVTYPTIDPSVGDKEPIIEYIGTVSTSTLTNHDKLTINAKAYPNIGDSTAVMDTSDAVYSQPTPLYAPIYGVLDTTNTYTASAYVDASQNIPGALTSGTCTAGEMMTQTTSGAIVYLISNTSSSLHAGATVSGTPTAVATWTGGTSGCIFTPTATGTNVGSDSNSCAVATSAFSQSSPPSPCATLNGAAVKVETYNAASATPTHADACGWIYSAAGYLNWMGASATVSSTTGNCWLTITPLSGVTQAQVIIDQQSGSQSTGSRCTTGSTSCSTPIHVKNLTVNVATSPVSLFNTTTYLWLDKVSLSATGTAPIYQVTDWYVTDSIIPSTLAGNGLGPFGTTNSAPALLRGNDVSTSAALMYAYTLVGNVNNSSTACWTVNYVSGQTAPSSLMPIIAFNGFYKCSDASNPPAYLNYTTGSIIGMAIVQNVFENLNTTNQLILGLTADASTSTPVNNVLIFANTSVGGRMNRSYNESGSTVLLRQNWFLKGNVMDQRAIKSDTFPTANAARVGNWAEIYGSGDIGNLFAEISGGTTGFPASGSFCNEFSGLHTYDTALSGGQPPSCATNSTINFPAYVSRAAYDGTNAGSGGGNYNLLSNSPAINMIPAGRQILPYDFAGQIRNNSGWGSAGAFEQAKVLTGVLAF